MKGMEEKTVSSFQLVQKAEWADTVHCKAVAAFRRRETCVHDSLVQLNFLFHLSRIKKKEKREREERDREKGYQAEEGSVQ